MGKTVEDIYQQLKEIWDAEPNALKCGGTYSSDCLKKALSLQIALEEHKDHPDYNSVREGVVKMIDLWRKVLQRHNQQALKVVEYDLETGNPK